MKKANLPQIPSGRGTVATDYGKPGGPAFGPYGVVGPPRSAGEEFGFAEAVRGHNRPMQSIGYPRPTQSQPRDRPTASANPGQASYTPSGTGRPPADGHDSAFARPGAPPNMREAPSPYGATPSGGSLQTDMTGRQPMTGREPMMVRGSGPAVSARTDSDTNPGRGGLEEGMTGPRPAAGNGPNAIVLSRGDNTGTAAAEGQRARSALLSLVRQNGGMPADLENPTARGRAEGLRDTMQSHEAGGDGLGVYPPGRERGPGMESHG